MWGQAGTWLQSWGTGNSRINQAFLVATDIWPLLIQPLLSETLPQRGRAGQSHSLSEVRARKTAASETKLGRGLVTDCVKVGSGQKLKTKDRCAIADRGEQNSDTRDWVAG